MEKLNHWLTLLANIGVIAGIIFLAVEINQNTDMMRAQTRSAVTGSIITLLQMERDPHVMSGRRKVSIGEDLTFEESYFLDNMANATFRQWENSFYQHKAGLFEEAEYLAEVQVGKEMMLEAPMAEHWQRNSQVYSEPFRDHVNQVLIGTSTSE